MARQGGLPYTCRSLQLGLILLLASTLPSSNAQVSVGSLPLKGKCPFLGLGPAVICQRYDVTCQISCPLNQIGIIPGQTIVAHLAGGIQTNTCASGDVLIALASALCNDKFAGCGRSCYATVLPTGAGP